MVEIGEAVIRIVAVTAGTFTTVSAPAGETQKISMVYAKKTSGGGPANDTTSIAPATGNESANTQGSSVTRKDVPIVGGNSDPNDSDSYGGLQPIFIDDSNGLYIGNESGSNDIDVVVQGVRIS
jgi:hypothetical protein